MSHDRLLTLNAEDRGSDSWMISYMDIMTLLVALFVLVLSLNGTAGITADAAPSTVVSNVSPDAITAARRINHSPGLLPGALKAAIQVASASAPVLSDDAIAAAGQIAQSQQISAQAIAAARSIARSRLIQTRTIAASLKVARTLKVSAEAQAAAIQVAGQWQVRQSETMFCP